MWWVPQVYVAEWLVPRKLSCHAGIAGGSQWPHSQSAELPQKRSAPLRRGYSHRLYSFIVPHGSARVEQPHLHSRISNSQVTSCGTMPPRLFAVTRSLSRSRDIASTSRCCPIIMGTEDRKDFRRVPRSWPSKTSTHRPRVAHSNRSGCFSFSGFSRFLFLIPGCAATASATTLLPVLR